MRHCVRTCTVSEYCDVYRYAGIFVDPAVSDFTLTSCPLSSCSVIAHSSKVLVSRKDHLHVGAFARHDSFSGSKFRPVLRMAFPWVPLLYSTLERDQWDGMVSMMLDIMILPHDAHGHCTMTCPMTAPCIMIGVVHAGMEDSRCSPGGSPGCLTRKVVITCHAQ